MPKLGEDIRELSQTYHGACCRMHDAVNELYEALHTSEGEAQVNIEYVYDRISDYRKWLLIEADLIREAVRQYDER